MNVFTLFNISSLLFLLISLPVTSQVYSFEDFIGTWNGTISATTFGGYNDPMTLTIEPDGFYTESSGHLMPSLYPNTQECEYEVSSNRMHFWYLGTVWGGQYFYDHHYYEVVYFSNDTLEMHYNFWNDPEPLPEAGTIILVRENVTPPPTQLDYGYSGDAVQLTWDVPVLGNGSTANPSSYNVYYKMGDNTFTLLDNTDENNFTHANVTSAGNHSYYITAVYAQGESDPSNTIVLELLTPEPESLTGQLLGNNVALYWDQPSGGNGLMAGLQGYYVYHREGEGEFEILAYVETSSYAHEEIPQGLHIYYVTAVYDGGQSDPSNEVEIELIISAIPKDFSENIKLFPNPAKDHFRIEAPEEIHVVRLANPTGQVVFESTIGGRFLKIDVNRLDTGLYIVLLEMENGTAISKRIFIR